MVSIVNPAIRDLFLMKVLRKILATTVGKLLPNKPLVPTAKSLRALAAAQRRR